MKLMIDILIIILATMIDLSSDRPCHDKVRCVLQANFVNFNEPKAQVYAHKTDTYLPGVPKTVRGPPTLQFLRLS